LAEARPDLPAVLVQLVHRMMNKDPAQRPQSGRDVLKELNSIRDTSFDSAIATSPMDALAAAVNSATSATTPVSTAIPKRRVPWRILAALVLAAGIGATFHLTVGTGRGPSAGVPAPQPSDDERFLIDMVHRFNSANLNDTTKLQAALKVNVQLAVLYLDQRRLSELEALAAQLIAKESQPSFVFLGNLLQGIYFSLVDDPKKSNTSVQLAFNDKSANKYLNQLAMPPSREAVDLRAYLREALERNEFALRYQPIIRFDYQPFTNLRGSFKYLEYQQPNSVIQGTIAPAFGPTALI
jgi:hypothetical protein